MANLRLIARLDVKGEYLIKGIRLEGLRKVGDPQAFARRYYHEGIDEIIYMDVVASLYGRNNLTEIVRHTAENVFIPITVGGGIRSVEDASRLLRAGADKIAVNTAATKHPELISELAKNFGSQCVVLSIAAKRQGKGQWEAYTDGGREHTKLNVLEWAKKGQELGAGEILLTSVDQEGTRNGCDVELIETISTSVKIPVIASGGLGSLDHFSDVVKIGRADAIAMAHVLHYEQINLAEFRTRAAAEGFHVRAV
jgi:cyclase